MTRATHDAVATRCAAPPGGLVGFGVPDPSQNRPPPDRSSFSLSTLVGLGLANAVSVAIGLFVGHYLDVRFGTAPVFVLSGLALGLTLGAVGSFLEIRRYLQD